MGAAENKTSNSDKTKPIKDRHFKRADIETISFDFAYPLGRHNLIEIAQKKRYIDADCSKFQNKTNENKIKCPYLCAGIEHSDDFIAYC